MTSLLSQEMVVLFAILAIGAWLGSLSLGGLSLGSAGIFFVSLVFSHYGLRVPQAVMELGLLLFVYAVGLQAGPRFFRSFRRHGLRFALIAGAVAVTGALTTIAVKQILQLPFELASGLYTGALTCTPALAGAIDAAGRISPGSSATISVGYGVAYPFSLVGMVLLMQFLPRLFRRNLQQEEAAWLRERNNEQPGLEARQFRVTNPNCTGKKISEINPQRMVQANISRIKHGEQVSAATADRVLQLGDVVMAVGAPGELEKMRLLLGEETHERMDVNSDVLSVDVEVTEDSLTGIKLGEMRVYEQYTIVITRIRRQGLEITPSGSVTLEMGDTIRVVGDRAAAERFVQLVHAHPQRKEETSMLPFLIGLLLGILVGSIPVNLPNGLQIHLGSAGGAFLVSLVVGHYGGLGPLRLYVPTAAKNLSRELGLMLFLAGAGSNAGAQFVSILSQYGPSLVVGGAAVTVFSAAAGLLVMNRVYRMNVLAMMGSLTACMTNPPGLSAANAQTETELPTLSYASVYPVALIFKIILAQVLVGILAGLG